MRIYFFMCIGLLCLACADGDLSGGQSTGGVPGGQGGAGGGPVNGDCRPGARTCIGDNQTQVCSDEGRWSVPRTCVMGVCTDGICTRSCDGTCTPGGRRCAPEGVQVCERDPNGCGAWAMPEACGPGQVCEGGQCQAEGCRSQCMAGARRCIGANGYSECMAVGQCAEWSAGMQCPNGESCSGGVCRGGSEQCMDACQAGDVTCLDQQTVQRCQQQSTGCFDYSAPEACGAGQRCSQPQGCVEACPPAQCQLNEVRCFQGGVQTCVEDRYGCAVWGAIRRCPMGMACQGSECVEQCSPECVVGETRCEGGGYQACRLINGCPAWGIIERCPPGLACRGNGECGDACRPGDVEERECGQCGRQIRECGNTGWSPWQACLERGECAPGERIECERCGVQVCNEACNWGPCMNQGTCAPGSVEDCGECGQRRCDAECDWEPCGNSNNRWRECRDCGWEFCCPEGDWCGGCEAAFPENCGQFGMCRFDGICIYEV